MQRSEDIQRFACKCLNVRISEQPRSENAAPLPSDWPNDSDYVHLYVGETGTSVAHPQVTSRFRTRGVPIPGTSRCWRFTSIMCLVCHAVVYRVYQVVSIDVEGGDGPLVPPEGWVEQEVVKSQTGWIDVHKDCLKDEEITRAELSADFSTLFSLVLPPISSLPSSSTPPVEHSPSQSTSMYPKQYLTELRPLFPPPPFSPSHPVFLHLSSLAKTRSEEIRLAADEAITEFIRQKEAAVFRIEGLLKLEVEALWKKFLEGSDNLRKERSTSKSTPRRESTSGADVTPAPGTTFSVRNFVPVRVPTSRRSQPASGPRVSALSASLATSAFHHPRAHFDPESDDIAETRPEARRPSVSSGSSTSKSLDSSSSTSTLTTQPTRLEGSSVLQFRRMTDDSINTAASYRWFMDIDEQIRQKRELGQRSAEKKPDTTEPKPNGATKAAGNTMPTTEAKVTTSTEASGSRGREKKKDRKVTFDVQPAVLSDHSRNGHVEEEDESEATGALVFDLDEEVGESLVVEPAPVLPLNEQPQPVRHSRTRAVRTQLNPFPSLRPASLPAPSHIRPPRSHQGVDSSSQAAMLSLPPPVGKVKSPPQEPLTAHEAEILKLVAADTPSHRGKWSKDSKAWKSFVRPHDAKDEDELDSLAEEEEESHPGDLHFVGSMPLPMQPRFKPRQPLSLLSYREGIVPHAQGLSQDSNPHAIPEEDEGQDERAAPVSAAAARKASYAERDRARSMDPGALDFGTGNEEEDDGAKAKNESEQGEADVGSRSRQQALEIIKARSELPDSGMWRSLV